LDKAILRLSKRGKSAELKKLKAAKQPKTKQFSKQK